MLLVYTFYITERLLYPPMNQHFNPKNIPVTCCYFYSSALFLIYVCIYLLSLQIKDCVTNVCIQLKTTELFVN